ncbi:hypothetical protein ACWIUD_08110 [Helicobacter sp. 23-1044]
MKILYFVLLFIATLLFSACAPTPIVYSPKQIDSFAIAPSDKNKLFSAPKDGYARLIIYRDDYNTFYLNDVFISYETNQNIVSKYVDNFYNGNYEIIGEMGDRALCRLDNDSSCVVNIRAGDSVMLYNRYDATIHAHRFIFAMNIITILLRPMYPVMFHPRVATQGTIFAPKNQHIYCLAIEQRTNFVFKNRNTCLKEYKEVYSPKHRDEQKEWFDDLVEKGDERAYEE